MTVQEYLRQRVEEVGREMAVCLKPYIPAGTTCGVCRRAFQEAGQALQSLDEEVQG